MLRVLFDTNIYARLAVDKNAELIAGRLLNDKEFIVYGFLPIRKELRDTPKALMLGRLKQRNLLLTLYDRLTKSRTLSDGNDVKDLANKYYIKSKELGAKLSWIDVKVDFMMVACASINKLDIVVSEDNKMLDDGRTLDSFNMVNDQENLRVPNFWGYNRLRGKYI